MKHAKTFVSLWAQAGGKEGACGVKKSVPKEVAKWESSRPSHKTESGTFGTLKKSRNLFHANILPLRSNIPRSSQPDS
jgi:hypothetical protein